MSTPKTPATPGNLAGTAKNILQLLAGSSPYITLGIEVAGDLIPLGKAAITGIKQLITGGGTVTYELLLQTDGAELDAVDKLSHDDIAAINAELAKLGLPAVQPPAQT